MTIEVTNRAHVDQAVGMEVKVWLMRKKVTQAEIAAMFDLTQPAISSRLNGKTPFTLSQLMAISGRLGITLGQLLGEEILNESGPDPRNADQGQNELLQLDLNQQPFD
ncbi:helix-turn-helix domain-containing protein [Glutamicibacter uratoxydans]|uniref:helix-turn-helix domain-containing protein n=1 Tax=Glutamicibacter uratoxydans TaxID=43667 RepID=UPI003D70143B